MHATVPKALEKYPDSQTTQDVAPVILAYLPASQSVHDACPTVFEYFPRAQLEHDFLSGALVFPVPHNEQLLEPSMLEKDPAAQAKQSVTSS